MNDLVSSFTVLYGSGGVRVIGTILFGTEGAAWDLRLFDFRVVFLSLSSQQGKLFPIYWYKKLVNSDNNQYYYIR